MGQEVFVVSKPVIDVQDKVGSVNVLASATGTKIAFDDANTFFVVRTGAKPKLVQVANDTGSGGSSFLTFHVKVNGTRIAKVPFNSFSQSLGETYRSDGRLAVPLDLPQGALIEVEVDNSDASNAYDAFIRLRVEYEDLN